MALTPTERQIVELIRNAPKVTIKVGNELTLTVCDRCPKDIAIAVQTFLSVKKEPRDGEV